jgi:hypothetical protein
VGLGPRLSRLAHAEAQTRLLLRRRTSEELRTVDGAAPNDLKPQRCQSQREPHNPRMIDVSGPKSLSNLDDCRRAATRETGHFRTYEKSR